MNRTLPGSLGGAVLPLAAALLATATLPAPLAAQELPSADEVVAAYVEAIGGREAHLAPASIRMTGTLEVPAVGVRGDFELRLVLPDRMVTRLEISGMGETLRGYDGETAWSLDPMSGPRILEGGEGDQLRERAHAEAGLRDARFFTERETLGLEERQGEECWKVRFVWRGSGRESRDCFSRETGLLLESETVQATPMGDVPVTTSLSDYREFHGMLVPTRRVQRTMGQEQVITIREVEVDGVDPSEVELPPEVRALLGG